MMNFADPVSEIALLNGTVATQDPQRPLAQAVLVGKGRILAVGRDEEILVFSGANTEKIDLNGRLVVPGFMDSHIHFYEWAFQRQGLGLDDLTRLQELPVRIGEAAAVRKPGQWIMGYGWNESDWVEPRLPDRRLLDQVAPRHPVLLWRCDFHLAVANSVALRMAGIHAGTPDPEEGCIDRDDQGEPTGILRELAINLVRQVMAPPSPGEVLQAFEDGFSALHRRGITGIQDVRLMADEDGGRAFQALQELDRQGGLPLKTWVSLPGDRLQDVIDLGLQTGFGNERLRIGHVKFFADGGMGARTAWMIDPYLDAAHGMPLMEMEELNEQIGKAETAGLSVMVHAIGDRTNGELIKIFEMLEKQRTCQSTSPPAIPHRMEHVQMIRPDDLHRLRSLDIGLCVNPANLVLDMNLIDSAVGEKGVWTYAFRGLMDTGAPVMFSSDCPVCVPDPLAGIHAAVTRQRSDGTPKGGWYPDSRVTMAEALEAYTKTPYLVHGAADIGTIAPRKKADLAVLSHNILTLPASQIPQVEVDMTLFDGRIVHRQF